MMTENLADLMKTLEVSFFDNEIRHSGEMLNNLISDEFIEFGRSGKTFNKQEIISMLVNNDAPRFKLDNFQINNLSGDVLLVNYISFIENENRQTEKSLRTSIWKLYGDKWKIIFHQGTPAYYN